MQTQKSKITKDKPNTKVMTRIQSKTKPDPKTTEPQKTETLHFVLHGHTITQSIRNFCLDGQPTRAWNVFASLTDSPDAAVEVFRNIIKGTQAFHGTSDLTLITPVAPKNKKLLGTTRDPSKDLTLDILSNIRRGKKEPIYKPIYAFSTHDEDGEENVDLGMSDEEIQIKNTQIEAAEKKRGDELTFFLGKMNLSENQAEEMMLKEFASENYTHPSGGWVTEKGQYLTVEHQQHESLLNHLVDAGYLLTGTSVRDFETRWVRITRNERVEDRMLMRLAGAGVLTARQKITLEKIILQMNLLQEGGLGLYLLNAYGNGGYNITMDNGIINFKKHQM